jgi:hypothetical protein
LACAADSAASSRCAISALARRGNPVRVHHAQDRQRQIGDAQLLHTGTGDAARRRRAAGHRGRCGAAPRSREHRPRRSSSRLRRESLRVGGHNGVGVSSRGRHRQRRPLTRPWHL